MIGGAASSGSSWSTRRVRRSPVRIGVTGSVCGSVVRIRRIPAILGWCSCAAHPFGRRRSPFEIAVLVAGCRAADGRAPPRQRSWRAGGPAGRRGRRAGGAWRWRAHGRQVAGRDGARPQRTHANKKLIMSGARQWWRTDVAMSWSTRRSMIMRCGGDRHRRLRRRRLALPVPECQ